MPNFDAYATAALTPGGVNDGIAQLIHGLVAAKQEQGHQEQEAFQNQLATRGADRADQEFAYTQTHDKDALDLERQKVEQNDARLRLDAVLNFAAKADAEKGAGGANAADQDRLRARAIAESHVPKTRPSTNPASIAMGQPMEAIPESERAPLVDAEYQKILGGLSTNVNGAPGAAGPVDPADKWAHLPPQVQQVITSLLDRNGAHSPLHAAPDPSAGFLPASVPAAAPDGYSPNVLPNAPLHPAPEPPGASLIPNVPAHPAGPAQPRSVDEIVAGLPAGDQAEFSRILQTGTPAQKAEAVRRLQALAGGQ